MFTSNLVSDRILSPAKCCMKKPLLLASNLTFHDGMGFKGYDPVFIYLTLQNTALIIYATCITINTICTFPT